MTDDLKKILVSALKENKENPAPAQESKKPAQKRAPKKPKLSISQVAHGNNINQAAGDIHIISKTSTKKTVVQTLAPNGSIGANAFLLEQIKGLFNELGLRREKRVGKTAYAVIYSKFKQDFEIPKEQSATAYLLWPESRAQEIISYLQGKLSKTIKGKNQKAAERKGHTAPYLLGETSRLHKLLGWAEDTYKGHLHYLFGVTSRSGLNPSQLANYVEYLKEQIDGRD